MKTFYWVFFAFTFLLATSCEQNSENDISNIIPLKTSPYTVGQIHNNVVTLISEDYIVDTTLTSMQQYTDSMVYFLDTNLTNCNYLSSAELELILTAIEDEMVLTDPFVIDSVISDQINIWNPIENRNTSLSDAISILNEEGAISDTEESALLDLQEFLVECMDLQHDTASFYSFINDFKANLTSSDTMLNNLVDIAENSANWWLSRSTDVYVPGIGYTNVGQTRALPAAVVAVIARDISGFLLGTVIAATASYYANDGDINWQNVGYAAIGGAIVGSTNLLARLAKLIGGILRYFI